MTRQHTHPTQEAQCKSSVLPAVEKDHCMLGYTGRLCREPRRVLSDPKANTVRNQRLLRTWQHPLAMSSRLWWRISASPETQKNIFLATEKTSVQWPRHTFRGLKVRWK